MRKTLPNLKNNRSDSGSAMMSVIMVMGLFALIATLYTSSMKMSMKAEKVADSKTKSQSVEKSLVDELSLIVKDLNEYSCLDPASINKRSFATENANATLDFVKRLKISDQAAHTLAAPHEIAALRRRCASPVFIQPSDLKSKSFSHLYFCLELNPNQIDDDDRSRSFVEVAVDFQLSKDDSRISCYDFVANPTALATVSYGLYMRSRFGQDDMYSKKFGQVKLKSSAGN
ncbi:MAG: hypothetical protein EOP04_06130 [Proteobacteria bacterium]|nr:MAG: hypothetical protein EOP04_06130 [Pseudomonadota bacterium]